MADVNLPFALPPPPPDRGRKGRIVFVVLAAAAIAAGAAIGAPVAIGVAVLLGAFAWLLVVSRRQEIGAALAMAALDRASRGRFDEARALLDGVAKNALSSYVGMMVDSQRAALALYEGDLERAVAEATKGAREGKRLRLVEQIHSGSALSIRAVALAALGRKDEALADVAKVRAARYRQGTFLARAALAEALLLAREKDLDALARLLKQERALLFGGTSARERMVARALARMVAAKKVSVYREPAKRDEQELDENASWVARIAPEAASYARAPKLGERLDAPPPVDPATAAKAEAAAPKAKRAIKRLVAAWVLLVALFVMILPLLMGGSSPEPIAATSGSAAWSAASLTIVVASGLFAFFVGNLLFRVVRARKATAQLSQAMELRYRGLYAEAKARMERLSWSNVVLVKPQAEGELALIASAEGDFAAARRHAEAGIAATRSSAVSLALSRPVLLPRLHGELAFALAASGKLDAAEGELAMLPLQFPSYPYLARDTFRARLVGLAAKGRYEEAAAMARTRPADLPLSMQEELLCDALRVWAGDSLPDGERERVALDLRDDVETVRFLDRVAPPLRARVHDRRAGIRVAAAEEPSQATETETETTGDADEVEAVRDGDEAPLRAARPRPRT